MRPALKRRHGFPHKRRWPSAFAGGEVLPVTFPPSPLATRVYIALGADLTASWLTWNWLDVTDRVRHDLGITVAVGRRDERTQVTAGRCQMKIENDDGAFCRRNVFSPWYGLLTPNTPVWIQLDPGSGFVDRFHGFINEWPTRWTDPSATDCTVTIQCAGVMRRLAQAKALRSPLFRTISGVSEGDYVPHLYYPMEDGSNSTQVASGLAGQRPAVVTGSVNFAADSELVGSAPLPTLGTDALVAATVPAYANTNQWVVQVALKIESEPAGNTTFLEVDTPGGSNTLWRLYIQPGTPAIVWWEAYTSSGGVTGTGTGVSLDGVGFANPSEAEFFGRWWFYTLSSYTNPDDGLVYGGMSITDDGDFDSESAGAGSATVHAAATGIRVYGGSGCSAGHLALFTDPNFRTIFDAFNNSAAMGGWAGELAHERIRRLCREERIPLVTQATTSTAMGPQPIGSLLAILRNCEAADQGFLSEHEFGLAYQALSQRYNQPVALELDFDQRHIGGTPEPADDDQRLVNKFTASRPDGSSGVAEEEAGTLGTGAGGAGVYEASATVNVESDDQLDDYASWKVHLGTVDEDRWPQLAFRLHGSPELIPGWLATRLGDRVTVANPPPQMNPDTIDQVIEGYAERWDTVSWVAGLSLSPASPYTVFVVEDDDLGLLDSGTSTLAADALPGATSLSVATSDVLDLWTTTETPFDVKISGVTVTVSAVSGASSPQTFTVTGVTKSLAAGAPTVLAAGAVLAL